MVMVCERYKIAYFSVPKVASTTLKKALYQLDHERPFEKAAHGGHDLHWLYPSHPHPDDALFARYADYWKIAIIRDPAQRILSAYGNRILKHADMRRGRFAKMRATLLGLRFRPELDEFVTRLRRYRLQSGSIRHHTDPLWHFLGHDLGRFDAVYPIADLPRLEADLSARVEAEVRLERLKGTENRKFTPDMLSDSAFDALLRFTRKDYDLVGAHFAPPERR